MAGTDDHDFGAFLQGIDADISTPTCWPSLTEDRLCQVIGNAILLYADLTAEEMIPSIVRMYAYVVGRVPAERRLLLLNNVALRFSNDEQVPDDKTRHRVDALLPFMAHDPDPRIVSTATLDFAVLRGRTDAPWLGVSQAFSMVNGNVRNPSAILMGLISLGDRRLSPMILQSVLSGDVHLAQEAAKFRPQYVFAAMVELCCDWLEALADGPAELDPGGITFGHVAAALHRLGGLAERMGVADISRCFPPAAPHLGAIEHSRWNRAEYAQQLQSRLRRLADRESAPRIIPEVMMAWGIS
jgi:hypothetical protein